MDINLGHIVEALSDQPFPFELRIECEGRELIALDSLEELQGELKNRTESDVVKILRSIRDYGFSFPFFYAYLDDHRYVLDGHGRLIALQIFQKLGGEVPRLPACKVEAEDENDAKQKLLRLNSRYGTIDLDGLKDFVDGLEVNVDDLELPDINIEDILIDDTEEEEEQEVIEKPKKTFVQIGEISESVSPIIAEKIINIINRRKQKRVEKFLKDCILLFPEN